MYAIKWSIFYVLNAATQEQIILYAGNAHVIAIYRTLVVAVCLFTPDHFKDKERKLLFVTCGKRTKKCDEKHEVV
jgi:hypothetical protein